MGHPGRSKNQSGTLSRSSSIPSRKPPGRSGSYKAVGLQKTSSVPSLPPIGKIEARPAPPSKSKSFELSTESVHINNKARGVRRTILEVLGDPHVKEVALKFYNDHLDKQDRRLENDELRDVLKTLDRHFSLPVPSEEDIDKLFSRFDFNGDGSLDFDEFFDMFLSSLRRLAFDRRALHGRDFFVLKQTGPVWDSYEKIKELGSGSFGIAHLCKVKSTGERRVVKAVKKSSAQMPVEDIEREILVMRQIDHPNIVRLFEWYEDKKQIYLVMDALRGGSLRDVLLSFHEKGRWLKEEWVRLATRQVLNGMAYCHDLRIIHKDLKDENIMLLKNDPNWQEDPFIVIIDLGCAEMFSPGDPQGKVVGGTPITMAPEVWMNRFGPKCDVWSVGVILFEMLSGSLPFDVSSLNPVEWIERHKAGPPMDLVKTSPVGRGLCQSMLTFHEKQRPSMRNCLAHDWFSARPKTLMTVPPAQFDALAGFCKQFALKRSIMLEVAARLPMERATKIVEVFKQWDVNRDASLSFEEMRACFKQMGINDEGVMRRSFEALDVNSDGCLSFSEFTAGVLPLFNDLLQERLKALFDEHDRDRDGALNKDDVRRLLGNATRAAKDDGQQLTDDLLAGLFRGGKSSIGYKELRDIFCAPLAKDAKA